MTAISSSSTSVVILPAFQGLKYELPCSLAQHTQFKPKFNKSHFTIQAAKLPAGVEVPKQEPKFKPPFLGFTYTAERWNSRACMMGLIGTFIVELILNKGILQLIGVEIGKGLDIPL